MLKHSVLSLSLAISMTVSATQPPQTLSVPEKALPLPQAASHALQSAIAQSSIPDKKTLIDATPQTDDAWRDFIWATNAEQKKKIKKMRKQFDVDVELTKLDSVTIRVLTPKQLSTEFTDKVYLDVHGGAYILFAGLPSIEEGLIVAHRLGIKVISVDYRMPPSHPFPVALNDVMAAYDYVLQHYPAENVFMGGTSAGGGLVLSTIQSLIEQNKPLPKAVYAGTPWADLTKTGDTQTTNEMIDRILMTYDGTLKGAANLYAGQTPLTDSRVSPMYGEFSSFPPTMLVSGTRDMFLSDTVRVNRKLRDAGTETLLEVYEGMSHADYLVVYESPESESVYRQLKQFLIKHGG